MIYSECKVVWLLHIFEHTFENFLEERSTSYLTEYETPLDASSGSKLKKYSFQIL